MSEARIGRVFVASLHQAIADIIPTRLEFYENWLNSAGLRHGTIGLAAMIGVIGFLRREDLFHVVASRAGQYAADWTATNRTVAQTSLIRMMPMFLRGRTALRGARKLVRGTSPGIRSTVRVRKGRGTVEIRGSMFCDVRTAVEQPLCTYYAAAIDRFLEFSEVPAIVSISSCRALGHKVCSVSVQFGYAPQPAASSNPLPTDTEQPDTGQAEAESQSSPE